jgi:asparagine synthase (glutamine-hydrolysing)
MCGISVIISKKGSSFQELVKMNDIIRHRGPDDEGFVCFVDSKKFVLAGKDTPENVLNFQGHYQPERNTLKPELFNVGLGHRRLSIIDLTAMGHQPMCDNAGTFWITYNGEIYNFPEVRSELISSGVTFRTETDTEVIIEAYKFWGIECQHKFNGMWAFVIYDTVSKEIFASRDRFGIKPLYLYTNGTDTLYFASEIKQFTTISGWQARLNHDAANDYLQYALTDHEVSTLFSGVYRILPGHYIKDHQDSDEWYHEPHKLQTKWYQMSSEKFVGNFDQATVNFRKYFEESIERHLRADVEVGSALSGGLDSSCIVSYINILLKKYKKSDLQKTFSSCANDKKYDEKEWMDEIIRFTGVDAHFVYPEGKSIFQMTEKILWHMDEPYQSQSVFLGYHVFEKAKEKNVKVLLNGQGADEYLSGYTDYKTLRLINTFLRGRLISFLKETRENGILNNLKFLVSNLITRWNLKNSIFFRTRIVGNFNLNKIINYTVLKTANIHLYAALHYRKRSVQEISEHQINIEPLQKYLRWEDRNSMAHSIEARVPFLDYRLVEFSRSLPLDFLDGPNESKKLLVSSLRNILPEKIAGRKDKKGFITPEEKWFKKEFRDEFLDMFRENVRFADGIINEKEAEKYLTNVQQGKLSFDYTYWRIILFCTWMKVFDVKI